MKKYMVLYRNPATAKQIDLSSEEKKKQREPWIAWEKKTGKALVVSGIPLINGMKIRKDNISHTKTQITGYTVIQAEDWEAFKAILADNPFLMMQKASFEVFEIMSIQ